MGVTGDTEDTWDTAFICHCLEFKYYSGEVLKAEWREGALQGSEIWLGWHGWQCLRRMSLRSRM